jgi:hypothetical protein
MMRKALLTAVVVTATVSSAMAASFELGINTGYGFGMGSGYSEISNRAYKDVEVEDEDGNITSEREYSEYKAIYQSAGKGIKLDVNADLFLNDNFGITLLTGISTLAKYEDIDNNLTEDEESENKTTAKASYIPFNLGVKLKADLDKFTPYAYVAPGVAIILGAQSESSVANQDTSYTGVPTEYSYSLGFAVNSGFGLQFNVSDKIGIKAEFAPTVGFARLKQVVSTDEDGNTETYIFETGAELTEDDISDEEDGYHDTYYSHSNQRISLSNSAIKIGIQIAF